MKNILVTGGNGQLASCLKDSSSALKQARFIFVDLDELDITDSEAVQAFFKKERIDYCINCAAYTAVDKAESEIEFAQRVNVLGAKILAEACLTNKATIVQISTDFVFDGTNSRPYTEEDSPRPISVYGSTKLEGERVTSQALKAHFILRTSWLYSEHGANFLKTMLRLGAERDALTVVADQIGTPTYAGDLAQLIIMIIETDCTQYGTYHYSNEGVASWYDFAQAIFDISETSVKLSPIKSEAYPTPAKRPAYSVMDKTKIKKALNIEIPHWRASLLLMMPKLIN